MFETSVSPPAPLNLDIEYQNADLWSLWGGCERTPCTPPPPLVTGLRTLQLRWLDGVVQGQYQVKHTLSLPHSTTVFGKITTIVVTSRSQCRGNKRKIEVNLDCFKLNQSYSISFNLSNLSIFWG